MNDNIKKEWEIKKRWKMRNSSKKLRNKGLITKRTYTLSIKKKANREKLNSKNKTWRWLHKVLDIQKVNKTSWKLLSVQEGLKEKIQDYQL